MELKTPVPSKGRSFTKVQVSAGRAVEPSQDWHQRATVVVTVLENVSRACLEDLNCCLARSIPSF